MGHLELLTPTAFSVIIVIQRHFFHKLFMVMIDLRFPRRQVTTVEKERRGSFSIAPTADEQEESQEGSSPSDNQNRFVFW